MKKRFVIMALLLSFLLGLALTVGLYLYRGLSYLLVLPFLLELIAVYLILSWPSRRRRAAQERLDEEFVQLFSFFGIYVRDGFNVYNALEKIKPFASGPFAKLLEALLKGIDEDKTVAPFIDFSSHFGSLSIREVMIAIFQMVEEGGGEAYVARFEHLFARLSEDKHEHLGQKAIGRLEMLSFLPLAGSGIAMLMLTIGIVSIMGEVLNGL